MQSLTTERLDLAPFDIARDLDDLHGMFKDPEWARGGFTDSSRDVDDTVRVWSGSSAATAD